MLGLQFLDKTGRADRDNAIDLYIGEDYMDVLADGAWENIFKVKPEVFTREEKRAWLDKNTDVALVKRFCRSVREWHGYYLLYCWYGDCCSDRIYLY